MLSHIGQNRFGFTAQLKYFQIAGRFPMEHRDVPGIAIRFLAKQLRVSSKSFSRYSYSGRTSRRDRSLIRELLGIRQPSIHDTTKLMAWLDSKNFPFGHQPEELNDIIVEWYRRKKIELPSQFRFGRIVSSAVHAFENKFFIQVYTKIPLPCFHRMDQLLDAPPFCNR